MQRPLFSLVNLSLTLVSPELGSKWWEAATVQRSDAPPMKGGSGDGRLQVGPGRVSATQGGRSNGASESAARVQRRMQSTPWAAGKAICAAGRTLTEEWAATQQYGRARLTRGTGLAT